MIRARDVCSDAVVHNTYQFISIFVVKSWSILLYLVSDTVRLEVASVVQEKNALLGELRRVKSSSSHKYLMGWAGIAV